MYALMFCVYAYVCVCVYATADYSGYFFLFKIFFSPFAISLFHFFFLLSIFGYINYICVRAFMSVLCGVWTEVAVKVWSLYFIRRCKRQFDVADKV